MEKLTFDERVKSYMKLTKEDMARTLVTRLRYNILNKQLIVRSQEEANEMLDNHMKKYKKEDMAKQLAELDLVEFPRKCAENI